MRRVALALFLLVAPLSAQPLKPPIVAQVGDGERADSALELAETLFGNSEFSEAKKFALQALADRPKSQRALMVLAKVAIATRQLDEAKNRVHRLLELDGQNADHHALSGMTSLFMGQTDVALASFQKALMLGEGQKTDSEMASYANSLVLTYHRANKPKEALETCLKSIEKYPQDGNLYLTCSRLYRESSDYSSALEVAETGLKRCPDFHSLYASISLAQAKLGNRKASEVAFDQYSLHVPENSKQLRATLDGIRRDSAEIKVRVE